MTFNISIPGNICCFEKGNKQIEADETIRLTIDPAKYPNLAKETVDALINFMTPVKVCDADGNRVDGYTYNVTVDDSDMPVVNGSVLKQIEFCDITEWTCKSCCDELSDRLEVVENENGTTYLISGVVTPGAEPNLGETTPAFGDTAIQKTEESVYEFWDFNGVSWTKRFEINVAGAIAGNITVTSGWGVSDVSGGSAVIAPGENLHLWSLGSLDILTVPGSARVRLEVKNITEATATAGAPAAPRDQTSTSYHLAADGLWFWDVSALAWVNLSTVTKTTLVGLTTTGNVSLTLTLSAAQIAAGFTTAHIRSHKCLRKTSVTKIGIDDIVEDSTSAVTVHLSAAETQVNGHEITLFLEK